MAQPFVQILSDYGTVCEIYIKLIHTIGQPPVDNLWILLFILFHLLHNQSLMAQFVCFYPNATVSGRVVNMLLKIAPLQHAPVYETLQRHGLQNPHEEQWYSLQNYLNAYRELSRQLGSYFLLNAGKQFFSFIRLGAEIQTLPDAVKALNEWYKDQHRGEQLEYFQVQGVFPERCEIQVLCQNPYPCYFDRGLLLALTKKYRPEQAKFFNVELHPNKPNRLMGSDESTYIISWV
jgi:hypothetical protein